MALKQRRGSGVGQQARIGCVMVAWAAALTAGCGAGAIAELHVARRAQKPIFVSELFTTRPNAAGEISATVQFFNTSYKTYKYADFIVIAYNRVGDRASAGRREPADKTTQISLTRQSLVEPDRAAGRSGEPIKLRFTGPLAPRRSPGIMTWPALWHRTPVNCLELVSIEISHMDGTSQTLVGPALADVIADRVTRPCTAR